MAERRHKRDTRTFEELNFSEQAKSISRIQHLTHPRHDRHRPRASGLRVLGPQPAQLVNLGRAIRHHARQDRATARTRAKLSGQVRRFAERMTNALEP